MSHIILMSPHEIMLSISARAKAKRLYLNLSQKSLAERSGVSLGSLKLFETSGKISLESLIRYLKDYSEFLTTAYLMAGGVFF
ncbi:MAG: hypothetical protein K0R14_56 [Burkholderiales bacterium]|jgi:transcriptional regulator with XRE-family HTH domain|nr:hypothetical protein [Burkholderiales bacterium]